MELDFAGFSQPRSESRSAIYSVMLKLLRGCVKTTEKHDAAFTQPLSLIYFDGEGVVHFLLALKFHTRYQSYNGILDLNLNMWWWLYWAHSKKSGPDSAHVS